MTDRFVTAFVGARDRYELPLALYEMNRLEAHVCDFYYPDALMDKSLGLPRKLRNRHRDGLPSRMVNVDLGSMARKYLFPAGRDPDPYLAVDRSLSLAAARLARRTGTHLFLHSHYAYWGFAALPDVTKFLYQFHPHAASVRSLLEADYAEHPEVRWSFENELDSQPLERQRPEALIEWQLADRIICASSFTKRSLVQQGCAAEIIAVVPYGIMDGESSSRRDTGEPAVCRFLFVGQGVQRKGLHLLLKAWKLAAPARAELVVVSRTIDPGLRGLLDQPNVRYFPGVERAALNELYESSAVFVMPSLVEGFGLVYLEALAAGLYCIGTANTGLPDLALPKSCVSIVPTTELDGLIEAMTACSNAFWSGTLSKTEIKDSVRKLTWEFRRAQLRTVITELLRCLS